MFGEAAGLRKLSSGRTKFTFLLLIIPFVTYPDMINIFEVFLPQLLRYPNPSDPLNGEAAALLMREPKNYESKVKGIIRLP